MAASGLHRDRALRCGGPVLHFRIDSTAELLERDQPVLAMMVADHRSSLDRNSTDTLLRFVMQGDGIPPRTAARLMMPTEPGNPVRVGVTSLMTAFARAVSWLGSEFEQALWPAGLTYRTQGTDMAFAAFLATGCGAFLRICLGYLSGGLSVGVTVALFTPFQALPPEIRLFVTTGFRGDLAAFSTCPAKAITPLRRERVWTPGSVSRS